ncbi:uncharacterized protein B0P05DRAFT_591084 [Gilbertella persicaria]|uniref:uncharacterized protein n=1 Tax=Gilbertella persicaria TaxID=101096 RepID=UPI00221F9059|nr:uncharacterized protein B0P05DRAFT_591084 [Gilbertella persicaria]KAI8058929.1 hypothetical protein B0P05DRAFT_591084 [Gilbertella persicaria]
MPSMHVIKYFRLAVSVISSSCSYSSTLGTSFESLQIPSFSSSTSSKDCLLEQIITSSVLKSAATGAEVSPSSSETVSRMPACLQQTLIASALALSQAVLVQRIAWS